MFISFKSLGQTYLFAELKGTPVNTTGWHLEGAAKVSNVTGADNSEIMLCPAELQQSGAIFFDKPINLNYCNKWTAEFDFRMYDGTVADGIAFCILDVPPEGYVKGEGLGIPATSNGIKIGFDTYPNCYPQIWSAYPKIELRWGAGYYECNPQPTVENVNNSLSFLRSNDYNHAKITYDKGDIEVFVNGVSYLKGFQAFNFTGYVGFTASTGDRTDNHSIKNVVIYTNVPLSDAGEDKTICLGQTVQLGAPHNPGNVYSWSPSEELDKSYIGNPTVTPKEGTHKYYVRTGYASSPNCTSIDSVTITVKPTSPISVLIKPSENSICSGSKVVFTADAKNISSKVSYQWKVNDINVGDNSSTFTTTNLASGDKVSCVIKDFNECDVPLSETSNMISIDVTPNPTPSITIQASATTICQGTPVSFTATAQNGGSDPKYQWKINGVDVAGASGVQFSSSTLKDGDKIECMLTSNSQCVADPNASSNIIAMEANKPVTPSITIQASATTICQGTPVSFTATAQNGGSDPKYQWKVNGKNVGTNSPTYTSKTLSNGDQIVCEFTSIVSDCFNNKNTLTKKASAPVFITINRLPVINVNPVDTIVVYGSQVRLNVSVNGSIRSFKWSNEGTLVNSSSLTPQTRPLTTKAVYQFEAITNDGCLLRKDVSIKIANKLLMPNAFTPNGDGKNDIYRIPPEVIFSLKRFSIFNRWGERVFYTEDISKGWDGRIKGIEQSSGVYIYTVEGTNETGSVFLKGTATLIR
jgi:gliding motility-associated-like protein